MLTQNLNYLAERNPLLLSPLIDVARGMVTAVEYYKRAGVVLPDTQGTQAENETPPEPEPEKEPSNGRKKLDA